MLVKPHTILYTWLKGMKISASSTYIRQQLNSHPDYPSLLSITDTLDELGIDNTAIQIEKDQLHEMPVPFIAHLNGNGGEFVLVKNRDNLDKQFPDFFKRWGGVAIAAEKPEGWHHKLNTEWLLKDKKQYAAILFTLTLLSAFILLSGVISFNWLQFSLMLTAIAGVFISWMIVSKDLGIENKLADEVCGSTADCNTVIHSTTAKLPFGIGWSDAGIIYFSFQLLLVVISSFTNTNSITVLALLATCSIPLTLLSVYYQWRVVKKWCRLCLITVVLLWVQFFILLPVTLNFARSSFQTVSTNAYSLTTFFLFITAAAWLWLKPLLKENKKLETENFAIKRFKNNAEVFMALLEKQRKVDTTAFEDDLQIGNPHAPLQIMVASNLFCVPCAKAHEVLHDLVEKNDIGLTVRVGVKTENKEDKNLNAVSYLLQLTKGKDVFYKRKVLHDWYEWMDMEKFQANYLLTENIDVNKQLLFIKDWSSNSNIKITPTIFIDGQELPEQYRIDDIKMVAKRFSDIKIKINKLDYNTP